MKGELVVLGLLAGAVAAGVAELVQTRMILERVQAEGVTVHLALPPFIDQDVHVAPHHGGGDVVKLPADAVAIQKRMHLVAGGVGVAAAAVAIGVALL